MLFLLRSLFWIFVTRFYPRPSAELQIELEALRHQVAVLHRNAPTHPKLNAWDRSLWVLLRSTLPSWKQALVMVSGRLWSPGTAMASIVLAIQMPSGKDWPSSDSVSHERTHPKDQP